MTADSVQDSDGASQTRSSDESGANMNMTWLQRAKHWRKTPSPSHVLIIAILASAGGGLAVPQEIPILRKFACDYYYNHHSGKDHLTQEARCQIPEIAQAAGEIITAARIFNAVMTVLCLTVYSDLLSRIGRKPMFAFTAFCLTASIFLFGLGAYFRGKVGMALIAANFFFSGIGSQPLLQLTFQSYIVDCVHSDERSPTFALLGAATFAGLSLSAVASASMTAYTNIPLLPFWTGTAVFFTMLLYAIFILPEALTAKRRQELMDANEATQNYHSGHHTDDHDDEPEGRVAHFFKRINFFKKLAILLPRKDDAGKGYDYRLFILAIAFLIYRIGGLYTNDLLLLTTTGSFGFTGTQNGILVGFITASKAILLMGLLPFLIRLGRNKYVEWVQQKANVTEGTISESSRLLSHSDDGKQDDEMPTGAERFDIYFAFGSFIIDALALTGVGMSTRVWQLYASTALLSISAAGGPSTQALFTQVSSKSMTDQVLSGVGIIENLGAILSPLVLGGIYSATSTTRPSTAWFVAAGLFIAAAASLLLVPSRKTYVPHRSRRARP